MDEKIPLADTLSKVQEAMATEDLIDIEIDIPAIRQILRNQLLILKGHEVIKEMLRDHHRDVMTAIGRAVRDLT